VPAQASASGPLKEAAATSTAPKAVSTVEA